LSLIARSIQVGTVYSSALYPGYTRWLSDERDPRAAIPSQAYADAADLEPG
jgi:hypothetical protein